MARRAAALALGLIPAAAWAASATLTWTMPTQNVDGSSIPASGDGALAQSRVEYGPCGSSGGLASVENSVTVPAPSTSTVINSFVGGETVCFRVRVKNNLGVESEPSNVVSKTFDAPKPRPPVLLSAVTVAYDVTLDRRNNLKLGRQVGTLALGTPCGDPYPTNKGMYFGVDLAAVTFTRQPRSSIVVTRCELV
ncbi:MAG: hypothetical protein VW362_01990 [Candidatus Nanopelagicales bacterium]